MYVYGDTSWRDKLTRYDGQTIEYDAIGNPTKYRDGFEFSWSNGRQLNRLTQDDLEVRYTYDDNGLRLSKTVNGVEYTYLYEGGLLVQETRGKKVFDYSYDASGNLTMLRYKSSPTASAVYFYYALNSRGDVIGLYNYLGDLMAKYTYDVWGNEVSVTNASGGPVSDGNIAKLQPFRYRSYYYDTESEFYYLQSRYYDPVTHRFINADSVVSGIGESVQGYNLFAYCNNNPVNNSDSGGNWPKWVTGALNVVSGVLQMAAGVALGATVGWTGVGAAAACLLIVNGAAQTYQGIGQIVNHVTNSNTMREDNTLRTSVQTIGNAVGGNAGGQVAGFAFDAAVFTANVYAGVAMSNPCPLVCFVAGTYVLTSVGNKKIEDIKTGDLVWSEDLSTGQKGLKPVVQTFVNETSELVYIYVNGEEIIATPEHPFYVPQKGWISACKLRSGDVLVLQNGVYVVVEKVQHEILESPIKVYNFEVADFHTYYVGDSTILVHNLCGSNHGNSLSTNKPAQGYILRDRTSYEILKYGETTRGYRRYTQAYLDRHNAFIDFVASGTKAEMHAWQHNKIINYVMISGQRPPMNRSFY